MKKIVRIEPGDEAKAIPGDCDRCVLAKAINPLLKPGYRAFVASDRLVVIEREQDKKRLLVQMDLVLLQRIVCSFDMTGQVQFPERKGKKKAIEFEAEFPDEACL